MRFRFKAAGLVAAAITAVGMAVVPASAAGGQVAAFTGATTFLSPPVQLVGGSGSFGFASSACEEASPANACHIDASGSYSNIVCGTGTASGSAFVTPRPGNVNFSIIFVSGIGVVTGGAIGLVDIIPTGVGSNPNCVTKFLVAGVLDP